MNSASIRGALVTCILSLAVPSVGRADYQDGVEAAKRGDYATAFSEWRPLAERGLPEAQFELGQLLSRGEGIPVDYDEAVRWLEKSAEQGFAPAQYRLGLHYYGGVGIAEDKEEAYFWIGLAAARGHEPAVRWAEEVDAGLTLDELEALERRIRAWRPVATEEAIEPEPGSTPPERSSAEAEAPAGSAPGPGGLPRAVAKAASAPQTPFVQLVQLAASRSPDAARAEWERIQNTHRDLLGDLESTITRADLGPPKGVFYRLRVSLADPDQAQQLCQRLGERGVDCLVVPLAP